MRRLALPNFILGLMILTCVNACDGGDLKVVNVDNHSFEVPTDYLVKGSIPWLPASQSSGLTFVINPKSPVREQIIVAIGSTRTTCNPRIPPVSNQLDSVCLAASQETIGSVAEQSFDVEKVHLEDDPTQWEYRFQDAMGLEQSAVVASCYTLSSEEGSGLCTSFGRYKNLVYSVGLRDSEIKHLPGIRTVVHELLTSWERQGDGG